MGITQNKTKICNKCGVEKPLSEFRKTKEAYSRTCTPCFKAHKEEYNKMYYKNNAERLKQHERDKRYYKKIHSEKYIKQQELASKGLKICSKCGAEKPLSDFHKDKSKASGHKPTCKECCLKMREPFKNKEYALKQKAAKDLFERGLKKCTRCNQVKPLTEYFTDRSLSNGYRTTCKQCDREYAQSEKGKLVKKKAQEKYRKSENGKQRRAEAFARYKTTEKYKESRLRYARSEKKRVTRNNYINNRMKNDPLFRFEMQARHLIIHSLERRGYKKDSKTFDIIGIPFDQFYDYLLQTYKDNYGVEWDGIEPVHIDHIIPLKTAETKEEIIKLCHYDNLQLLKPQDNLSKKDKLDWTLDNKKGENNE